MMVFDEFPTTSLMDADNRIDAKRYPGFAELGKDATWFRGAHSIYDSTSKAVPAIMDGDYPEKGTLPTASEHPNSIFALLGKSHRMNVSEEATTSARATSARTPGRRSRCWTGSARSTGDLGLVYAHVVSPPGIERDLPSVSDTWGDFGGGGGGVPHPPRRRRPTSPTPAPTSTPTATSASRPGSTRSGRAPGPL